MTRPVRSIRFALLLLATVWNLGWTAAAWLASSGSWQAFWVYAFYTPICHQLPARSFYLWNHPLAVCSRCASIYTGFWMAVTFLCVRSIRRPHRYWIVAVAGIITAEFVLELIGLRASSFASRAATGLLAGLVLAPFVVEGVEETVRELWPNVLTRSSSVPSYKERS